MDGYVRFLFGYEGVTVNAGGGVCVYTPKHVWHIFETQYYNSPQYNLIFFWFSTILSNFDNFVVCKFYTLFIFSITYFSIPWNSEPFFL